MESKARMVSGTGMDQEPGWTKDRDIFEDHCRFKSRLVSRARVDLRTVSLETVI